MKTKNQILGKRVWIIISVIALVISVGVFLYCKYCCIDTFGSLVYAVLSPFFLGGVLFVVLWALIIEQEFISDISVKIYNLFQRKKGGKIKPKPQNTFLDCFNENGEIYLINFFIVVFLLIIVFFPELREVPSIISLIVLIGVVLIAMEEIIISLKQNTYKTKKLFWYHFIKYGKIYAFVVSTIVSIISANVVGYRSIDEYIINIAIVMVVSNITLYVILGIMKMIKNKNVD